MQISVGNHGGASQSGQINKIDASSLRAFDRQSRITAKCGNAYAPVSFAQFSEKASNAQAAGSKTQILKVVRSRDLQTGRSRLP
jgi:hypothetical protein